MGKIRQYVKAFVYALVATLTGCSLPGDKARMGWGFYTYKPPIVNTDMPVVVPAPNQTTTAHPLGHFAAPLQQSPWITPAPMQGLHVAPQPAMRLDATHPPCGPTINARLLTCEEWCAIYKTMQAKPMPQAQE